DLAILLTDGAAFPKQSQARIASLAERDTIDCNYELTGYGDSTIAQEDVLAFSTIERRSAPFCLVPRDYLYHNSNFHERLRQEANGDSAENKERLYAHLLGAMKDKDRGRRRTFLPVQSAYHDAAVPAGALPFGTVCKGDSGA